VLFVRSRDAQEDGVLVGRFSRKQGASVSISPPILTMAVMWSCEGRPL
jgi:hypothetical protein